MQNQYTASDQAKESKEEKVYVNDAIIPKFNVKNFIYVGVFAIIFVLFGLVVLLVSLDKTADKQSDNSDKTADSDLEDATDSVDINPKEVAVSIISPSADSEVSGEFEVKGSVNTSLEQNIVVKVLDFNGTILAESNAEFIDINLENQLNWSAIMKLSSAPTEGIATLVVFNDDVEIDSFNIVFKTYELPDRLKVTSPIDKQLINGEKLILKGEMQGFFEGHLSFRLDDENNNEIAGGYTTALGDNYFQFAPFEAELNIPSFSAVSGKLVFYNISMNDGAEETLLEIPVIFK